MNKILFFTALLFTSNFLKGQTPVGSWSDHLAYNTVNCLAVGTDEVFASTGASVIVYNKSFAELKKLSRINGLTETGIGTIGWSEENKTLIIAYSSTNIDLVKNNVIYNIPDIYRKYIPGSKVINRIRTSGKYAYLACSFGIVVIDLVKREVYDTWKPGDGSVTNQVWDIAFGNGKIFSATDYGLYSGDQASQGLAYFGNWSLVDVLPSPSARYTALIYSGDRLFANLSNPVLGGDEVYVVSNSGTLFEYITGVYNNSFDKSASGFTISSEKSVRLYDPSGKLTRTISSFPGTNPSISQAIEDKGTLWVADVRSGLLKGDNLADFTLLTLPGPTSNNAFYVTSANEKTVICGGAIDGSWNNQNKAFEVSVDESESWSSLTLPPVTDPLRALIDPLNSNHMFISTWGSGLLEYENNVLKKQFTEANSPLQNIIPGRPYVRICGLAIDKAKNLWITQTGVPGSIKILKADGTWIVNPITIEAPTIGDIIITSAGQKWIVLPRGYGLFVLDDRNTPDVFTDDRAKKLLVQDTENQPISYVYSVAEDLDGNIWVGTDQGPLIYFNPEKVFDSEIRASRIKIPRNDGTNTADYMLKTETITSMAVDGANRKWIGTAGSGVYLLSPDGTSQLKSFNEQNSPLFSNSIISVSIDNKSGDVWFATSKGVQSYRSNATSGGERFSKVYSFPNPVREDFHGNVTITGLLKDTQIRITDISGNLVTEMVSDGGEATWDLKTYNGKRVTTGVYLVFCASKDGSQSCVTKMLVIK